MSRWGYALLLLILMGLGGYAWWPQHDPDGRQPFWPDGIPQSFSVIFA